jgi:hypothetical protein
MKWRKKEEKIVLGIGGSSGDNDASTNPREKIRG